MIHKGVFPIKGSRNFHYAVYDIESSGSKDDHLFWTFEVVGCYDGERIIHCDDIGDFLELAVSKRYNRWIFFAHNAGRYDDNIIFDWLMANGKRLGYSFEFFTSGSSTICFRIRRGKYRVDFCDSYALLKGSLKSLCIEFETYHKKKLADEFDQGFESLEYLDNDLYCLWEVLEKFFSLTMGCKAITIASLSLKIFKSHFLSRKLWSYPDRVLHNASKSYWGGRTEVYKTYGMTVEYDIKSMYPSVMTEELPVHFLYDSTKLHYDNGKGGIYYAKVKCPDIYIPVLPTLYKGKLLFPLGEFAGWFTGIELSLADELGYEIKIMDGHIFQMERVMEDFVKHFYAAKENASGRAIRYANKIILNSLYGKFAEKPEKEKFVLIDESEDAIPLIYRDDKGVWRYTGIGIEKKYQEKDNWLPAISSWITSASRVKLYRSMLKVSETLHYCDTDSVHCADDIETGNYLGAMEKKSDFVKSEYYLPKFYRRGDIWKVKGVSVPRKLGEKKEDWENRRKETFERYAAGSKVYVPRAVSMREAARSGIKAASSKWVPRQRRFPMPKRCFDKVGNSRPWVLSKGEIC